MIHPAEKLHAVRAHGVVFSRVALCDWSPVYLFWTGTGAPPAIGAAGSVCGECLSLAADEWAPSESNT